MSQAEAPKSSMPHAAMLLLTPGGMGLEHSAVPGGG